LKGYKLTKLGKTLVTVLAVVLLCGIAAIVVITAGALSGNGNNNSQITAPPYEATDDPSEITPPEATPPEVTSPEAMPSDSSVNVENNTQEENNENGTEENGNADNGYESTNGDNGSEEIETSENNEQNENQSDEPEPVPPPNFDPEEGTLTIYVASNADGEFDDATNDMLDEFLRLPQNNLEYAVLVTVPLLEMDELHDLAETMINALTGRGVQSARIVFTTNEQNRRIGNPTFEVTLSFLEIRPK